MIWDTTRSPVLLCLHTHKAMSRRPLSVVELPINCQAYPTSGRCSKPEVGPMSECPSARCRAAVGFDWHLVGNQVVTRHRPAVSMPIGSLLGRRRLCWHSSGNPTSACCQYAHRVTVSMPIGSLSGRRGYVGNLTSARCRAAHRLPVRPM